MKTKTKALALVLSAVLLVVTTVFTTMAFLTSTDEVKNTFTVGNVEITLDEAKVDEYGVKIEGADRVQENEYKLIPGHTYVKDPTVTVTKGSEPCYVRMIVTITDFADVKEVFGDDFLPQNFVNGWDGSVWESTNVVNEDKEKGTATYEFWYKDEVDAREGDVKLDALFDEIFVLDNIDGKALEALEEMEINIVAHAIQADGFNSAKDAWDSWPTETGN